MFMYANMKSLARFLFPPISRLRFTRGSIEKMPTATTFSKLKRLTKNPSIDGQKIELVFFAKHRPIKRDRPATLSRDYFDLFHQTKKHRHFA